jgi:peptidoglycan hydrolase-like protein with peptidoglycan-binding domain
VVLLYVSIVGKIRQRLSEEGFPAATSMESLLEAIAAFQAQNGLPVTGLPSQNTLAILLR